jgi:RNA polymerase sigma-70 factor, ECF subfamily
MFSYTSATAAWIPFAATPWCGGCATLWRAVAVQVDTGMGGRSRTEADVAMDRYAAGDDAAFGLVYDALAPRLLGYLLRRTRDPEDAADLLQQTMLHIHRARGDFITGAEVTPWAFAIARRLLVDSVRRGGPGPRSDSGGLDTRASEAPRADDLVHAHELSVCIERTLAQLPASQRMAFQLIKQDGLSLADAARVLGTTVGAAKVRVHRAYEALRAALAGQEAGLRRGRR